MKAIIPVAGAGTSLRPHTYTQHKALIPLAGKPILAHIIEDLESQGVSEFIFIIGYLGEKIRSYVTQNHKEIKSYFITQENRNGTAHAIGLAQDIIGGDQVMIVYGDTIVEMDYKKVISSKGNFIGTGRVENPSEFGVVELEGTTEKVIGFVEKPKMPKSNMAMVGVFKIEESGAMFEAISEIDEETNQKEEQNFTAALQKMLDKGSEFTSYKVDRWFDCGKKENILETNKILLQKLEDQGKLINKEVDGSIILEPTIVGKNSKIENSIVGPYTSIGDNVVLSDCIISESIIGDYANLSKINLAKSLIGSDVIIKGNSQELNIGDNTEIDLS